MARSKKTVPPCIKYGGNGYTTVLVAPRVNLVVVFTFLLQKFEKVAGTITQMVFCQSMSAV